MNPVLSASATSTPSAQTTNTISTDSTATNPHKQLEERKSVVAGIQSRLFPQGKFPPHKPTFQPPSNVLTASQHGSVRGNVDSDSVPVVQMRHSVVDPTKLGLSSVYFDDQHLSDVGESGEEPKQLESLTKLRPKQNNKRPPSTQFRSSKVVSPFLHTRKDCRKLNREYHSVMQMMNIEIALVFFTSRNIRSAL